MMIAYRCRNKAAIFSSGHEDRPELLADSVLVGEQILGAESGLVRVLGRDDANVVLI